MSGLSGFDETAARLKMTRVTKLSSMKRNSDREVDHHEGRHVRSSSSLSKRDLSDKSKAFGSAEMYF